VIVELSHERPQLEPLSQPRHLITVHRGARARARKRARACAARRTRAHPLRTARLCQARRPTSAGQAANAELPLRTPALRCAALRCAALHCAALRCAALRLVQATDARPGAAATESAPDGQAARHSRRHRRSPRPPPPSRVLHTDRPAQGHHACTHRIGARGAGWCGRAGLVGQCAFRPWARGRRRKAVAIEATGALRKRERKKNGADARGAAQRERPRTQRIPLQRGSRSFGPSFSASSVCRRTQHSSEQRGAPHAASCRARGAERWSCTSAAATAHLDRGEDDGDRRHAAHEDRHSLEPFGVEQLHDLLRSPTAHRACRMQRALSMS
jgi:hypothetical protein